MTFKLITLSTIINIIMKWSEVTQLCPTLSDPVDCSLPVSSVHGIFQARVLEWGAIAFSDGQSRRQQMIYRKMNDSLEA